MDVRFGPLLFIPGINSGKYPFCHSLYIEADLRVLIDPASDRDRLIELRNSSGVNEVWLSHYHEDHFMHLDLFDDKELRISELDAPAIKDLDHFFDAREPWRKIMTDTFHFKPRRPDKLFQGNGMIDLGGVTVEVIPTPGHTPGHCAFLFQEPEVLFIGDYDLTPFGPWYGDVESDIDATIASVKRLRTIPAQVWVTSHEKGVFREDPGELWGQYLRKIDEREEMLLESLREPRRMPEIVEARILYGKKREPKEFYDFGERTHMAKHLERLTKKGLVQSEDGVYRRV